MVKGCSVESIAIFIFLECRYEFWMLEDIDEKSRNPLFEPKHCVFNRGVLDLSSKEYTLSFLNE